MRFLETLASYVPGLIVEDLIQGKSTFHVPRRQRYDTVCIFCDVSGYTALSEAMARNGQGAEGLARVLNSYFAQMVRLISSDGGDVCKFAGDAMIVLWPPGTDDMTLRLRRATQCAIAIQEYLNSAELETGVSLSVKIGIGYGTVNILHIGGMFNRMEFLPVGDPLLQAFSAEGHAEQGGEIVVSAESWRLIEQYFCPETVFDDGYVRLDWHEPFQNVRKQSRAKLLHTEMSDPTLEHRVCAYVPGAVLPNLNRDNPQDENWANETRYVSTIFVNLGLTSQDLLAAGQYNEAMHKVHDVLHAVQTAVYRYEGSINKFLMDDKGSTLIACFGLPPVSHEDDSLRAVLAALLICEKLFDLGLQASIGITTGPVFCGVVGNRTRREYTILGDAVNASARLMQASKKGRGGVLCDVTTKKECAGLLCFQDLGEIKVKGKEAKVQIFAPYPDDISDPRPPVEGGANLFAAIHTQQLKNSAAHKALTALQPFFTRAQGGMPSAGGFTQLARPPRPSSVSGASVVSMGDDDFASANRVSLISSRGGVHRFNSQGAAAGSRSSISAATPQGGSTGQGRTGFLSTLGNLVRHHSGEDGVPPPPSPGVPPSPAGGGGMFKAKSGSHRRASRPSIHESSLVPIAEGKPTMHRPSTREVGGVMGSQVVVTVPADLRLDNISERSPTLNVISFMEVPTFGALLREAKIRALQDGLLSEAQKELPITDFSLNFSGTRLFLPQYSENDENDLPIRWLPHVACEAVPPSRRGSIEELLVPQCIEMALVRASERFHVQSRTALARRMLLECKVSLLGEGSTPPRGRVVVLEGEPGSGKTTLLANFAAWTLPRACPIFFVSASSFCPGSVGGAWCAVIKQFVNFRIKLAQKTDGDEAFRNARTTVTYLLREYGDDVEWAEGELHLLNDLLDTDFPADDERDEVKDAAAEDGEPRQRPSLPAHVRRAKVLDLLFVLVKAMAEELSPVVIIDDAHFADPATWSLCLGVGLGRLGSVGEEEEPRGSVMRSSASATAAAATRAAQRESSARALAMLLVCVVRPLKHYQSFFSPTPPDYEELVTLGSTVFIKVDGLPPEEVEELMCEKLGTHMVSDQLFKLVEDRCLGFPQAVQELMITLRTMNPPVLHYEPIEDGSGLVELSGEPRESMATPGALAQRHHAIAQSGVSFRDGFHVEDCPLPSLAMKQLAARVDRCTSLQQLILKTAALCPKRGRDEFFWGVLLNVFPTDTYLRIGDEIDTTELRQARLGLEDAGILVEVQVEHLQGNPLKVALKYNDPDSFRAFRFLYGHMPTILCRRMLKWQTDAINAKIKRAKSKIDATLRQRMIESMPGAMADSLKEGKLEIHKDTTSGYVMRRLKRRIQGGDWKTRHCRLSADALRMFKERDWNRETPPTQIIYMEGARCELEPPDLLNKHHCLRIDAQRWEKDGRSMSYPRSFILQAETEQDVIDWEMMIKLAIERAASHKKPRVLKRGMSSTGEDLVAAEVLSTEQTEDGRLSVHIHSARNLISADDCQMSNPYVVVDLGDKRLRTSYVQSISLSPTWDENLAFGTKQRQWLRGTLVLQVYNRDFLLSDDFLGQATIALSDVRPRLPNEPAPAAADGDWVPLFDRGGTRLRGELCLSATLDVSAAKVGEIEAAGGLDAFLEAAEAKMQHESGVLVAAASAAHAVSARNASAMRTNGTPRSASDSVPQSLSAEGSKPLTALGQAMAALNQTARASPRQRRVTPTTASTSGSIVNFSMLEADVVRRIRDDLALIEQGSVVDGRGQLDPAWVSQELNHMLVMLTSERRDSALTVTQSKLTELVDRVDLADHDKRWLESEYMGGLGSPSSAMGGSFRRASVQLSRTSSPRQLDGAAQGADGARVPRQSTGPESSALPTLKLGPPSERTPLPLKEQWFYVNAAGEREGPFAARQMLAWVRAGYLHEQVVVLRKNIYEPNKSSVPLPLASQMTVLQNDAMGEIDPTQTAESLVSGAGAIGIEAAALLWPEIFAVFGTHVSDFFENVNHPTDIERQCYQWDFNVFNLSPSAMLPLVAGILHHMHAPASFEISSDTLVNFVREVERYMLAHGNPYHNLFHAVDVMQSCFVFATTYHGAIFFTEVEVFSLLIAGLCHDLNHPGLNNKYQVNAGTRLAIMYNDVSPLENHHAALAFQILTRPENNLIKNMEKEDQQRVRKTMIAAILATDMTVHFNLKDELDACIVRNNDGDLDDLSSMMHSDATSVAGGGAQEGCGLSIPHLRHCFMTNPDDREILLKSLCHIADISNPAKAWKISKMWSDRVIEEFFAQGDREKAEGLAVSPACDRETTLQTELSLNFIDFIVAPFFVALTQLMPLSYGALKQLSANRRRWHELLQEEIEERSAQAQADGDQEALEKHDADMDKWNDRASVSNDLLEPIVASLSDSTRRESRSPAARKDSIYVLENYLTAVADKRTSIRSTGSRGDGGDAEEDADEEKDGAR